MRVSKLVPLAFILFPIVILRTATAFVTLPLKHRVYIVGATTYVYDLAVAVHQLVLDTIDNPRVVDALGTGTELGTNLGGATDCHGRSYGDSLVGI
jgi:hypothetical protein